MSSAFSTERALICPSAVPHRVSDPGEDRYLLGSENICLGSQQEGLNSSVRST